MSILDEAAERVDGSANIEYGPTEEHFESVSIMWTEILKNKLEVPISPYDVGLMMASFKLVRLAHAYKRDSLIDAAGYLRCTEIVKGDAA